MLDVLSRGFKNARLKLAGKTKLDEQNVGEALREVRTSLIQADVQLDVVKDFLEKVKASALGEIVDLKAGGLKVTAEDHFVKACYDQLVELMGPVDTSLDFSGEPAVILMVGLQGSGKTTTAGKLAKRLLGEGKRPMMVAADIYRPAAVEQLMTLGRKLDVPVFSIKGLDPVSLSRAAMTQARSVKRDVVIIDTAGRLAIDERLMLELEGIKDATKPKNILFVCDAMMGQDAVKTASEFDRRLSFTGFILTKLDGDARGGAALSIKAVTGKPIKFLGQGEGLEALEEFRPDGLSQRILGFGDVVGLMKDFEKHVDQKEAESDTEKLLEGSFTYDDFVRQMATVRKMGPIRELLAKMPIMNNLLDQIPEDALDDREMDRAMAIVGSMTKEERRRPSVIDPSRLRRIARGSGRSHDDVQQLHDRFIQARTMMRSMGGMMKNPKQMALMQQQFARMQQTGDMSGLANMAGLGGMGGFPAIGGPGAGAAPRRTIDKDEKIARRQKQKDARKARRKNRK